MFLSLTRFNSLEPGNVTCDFEESSGCDYAFGSHFVWREGYIHQLLLKYQWGFRYFFFIIKLNNIFYFSNFIAG
jgi:hypothetical protein